MARPYLQRMQEEAIGAYLLPLLVAVLLALLGGFSLGILAALARAQGWGLRGGLGAVIQAHGHVQLTGWAGLFIVGMAYRLVPRFVGAPPVRPLPFLASCLALAAGVAVRGIGQPLAQGEAGRAVLWAAAALEVTGAALFCREVVSRLWPALRRGAPFAPHLMSMALWLVAVKALFLAWAGSAGGGGPVLMPFLREQALVTAEMVGFVLSAVIGVSLRTVLIFFGRPLPWPLVVWAMWAPLQVGLVLYLAALAWREGGLAAPTLEMEAGAHMLMGGALLAPALLTAFWRPPLRLRTLSRGPGRLVQMGMAWLMVGGVMLAVLGAISLAQDAPIPYGRLDAARHVLGVGTVTTMILGMAYLLLPPFALARQHGLPYGLQVRLALVALPAATALRALGAWTRGQWGAADVLTACSGILAWVTVAAFALALARTVLARLQSAGGS